MNKKHAEYIMGIIMIPVSLNAASTATPCITTLAQLHGVSFGCQGNVCKIFAVQTFPSSTAGIFKPTFT